MKNYSELLIILSLFAFPYSVNAALTDGIVSYWQLDESSGTRVDEHGSNDLTDNNTVGSDTGIIGQGADFERDNDEYLSISDASQSGLDPTDDISFSYWVKLETEPGTDESRNMLTKITNGSNSQYQLLYYNNSGTKTLYFIAFDDSNCADNKNFSVVHTLGTGSFVHVVVTYDISANEAEFFVNGSSIGTSSGTGTVDAWCNTSSVFSIGAYGAGFAGSFFDGLIDEVGIWDRKLTGTEITQLYNAGNGLAYPFTPPPTSVTGSGTTNRIAKFTSSTSIGNSIVTDDGSNLTVTGGLIANFLNIVANNLGIDTLTSGILSIGSTTASAINIARSGVTTTIFGPLSADTVTLNTLSTKTNCASSSSPASCSSAAAGSVVMLAGGSTLVVNTTAITANSQILITEDMSLNSRLGVTCNTTTGRVYSVQSRATSTFTIKSDKNPNTSGACLNYLIVN